MIGMELLNLLYGDPLARAMAPPQPAPNPNPQAPPPSQLTAGGPPPGTPIRGPIQNQPHIGPAPVPQGGAGSPPSPSGGQGQPSPPPSLPQSGPPSTAPQSPQDLGQLYLQLMQRDRAANAIDRGLAGLAVANAAPGYQGAIAQAMAPQQYDPGRDMQTLMQLQYMSQMANMPAPGSGGAVGGAGGGGPTIDPALWARMLPDQRAKWLADAAAAQIGIQTKGAEQKQTDLIEARKAAPGAIDQFTRADELSNQIMNATEADGSNVMQNITSNVLKRNAAQAMIDAQTSEPGKEKGSWTENAAYYLANLTQAEKDAINNAIQLNGMVYGESFANAGSRRTQGEIKGLQSGASQLLSFNQSYGNYQKQFSNFQDRLHTSIANAAGEAGMLDTLDPRYRWTSDGKPRPNSEYLPGGPMYAGGGDWVNHPPAQGNQPVQIAGPGDIAKLPKGTPFVIPSGPNQGKIGYAQ